MSGDQQLSSYLQNLPGTFQTQKVAQQDDRPSPIATPNPLLGRFLLAFERILSGLKREDPHTPPGVPPGVEQMLASIPRYFVPLAAQPELEAPAAFLPWLAGWVAVSLRGDWSEAQQRSFIQQVPSLYQLRGTLACMERMVSIYTQRPVTVVESPTVPHFFTVTFSLPNVSGNQLQLATRAVRAIIDQEKPAYTYYGLNILVEAMELPAIVGETTILGGEAPSSSSSSSSSNGGV